MTKLRVSKRQLDLVPPAAGSGGMSGAQLDAEEAQLAEQLIAEEQAYE